MNRIKILFFIIGHLLITNLCAHNNEGFYGVEEKTGMFIPEEVWFYNEDSVSVNIAELIDKPTILSFVYFSCPDLCTPILEGIAELIEKTGITIGENYQVFTISIDETETPQMARNKKETLIKLLSKKEALKNWQFFTGDTGNIQMITEVTGWKFKRNGNGFIHSAAIVLITPEKKISQYLYGKIFNPVHFQLSVNEAWKNNTSAPRIETLKYCYNYEKKVNWNSTTITAVSGIIILLSIVILFIRMVYYPGNK